MSNKTLTTAAGRPVEENQNSMTAGPRGPVLMQDYWLLEKLAHFDRERIPERVVHAKGSGAFGTFTVTHDITQYSMAKVFKPGSQTPVFLRFSTVAGEAGAADAERDVRGFALKFYTEDGNWDLVGNNTPVFFIRDPLKFPDFIHTQKRDPRSHLRNMDMRINAMAASCSETTSISAPDLRTSFKMEMFVRAFAAYLIFILVLEKAFRSL